MVWVTGGYIMETSQAKAWAQRKYPEIPFPDDWFIPNEINRYFRRHKMYPACISVCWRGENKAFFMTHGKTDHSATKTHHRHFREDPKARTIRKLLFEDLEDELEFLKDIQFVTVSDPYDVGPRY
ncbi:hypothetical protein BV22DRAFT_1074248 [Leucogyrophana mollusca]|uniref:Uncharacterized protein n=1 Tax=Leucogyrophana mollusca TaxID=85980 RepID=A0ACB8B3L4_9AGAM|nr:hypothetical protein BV22DRAFT_1074248 [Leucogyrophana mollusca]